MIGQETVKSFLLTDDFDKLLPLYTYYYYKCRKQFTSAIDCPDTTAAIDLKWSRQKVSKYRKELIEMGYLSLKILKNTAGMEVKRYIVVNYVWSKSKIDTTKFDTPDSEAPSIELNTSEEILAGEINEQVVATKESYNTDAFSGTLFAVPIMPDATYSSHKMDVGIAANMIANGKLLWAEKIILNPKTGLRSDYITVITWWLNGFPLSEKKKFGKMYGDIRFDYIKEKFIKWASKEDARRLELPYRTLIVFYEKQMTANDYMESRSLNVSEVEIEIQQNTCVWKKDMVFSLQGSRDDYERVMYWWFTNLSDSLIAEFIKTYGIKDISPVAYQLYLEMKSDPRRYQSFLEKLVKKLNYIASKR